jgi:hypothetical protein
MKFKLFTIIFMFSAITLNAQVKELNRIGQTPGSAGFHVNYDSLNKKLIVGCGTSIWVYDTHDTSNIRVIAKRPLLGLINETELYGNVLFVAASHDGLYALNYNSDSLDILAHYNMQEMKDTAAYDMWRSNDTLFIADNFKIRMLKYIPGNGFIKLGTFGPNNSNCVTRRGNIIAVGSQGLPGTITIYNITNLSTPLATWSSNSIFSVQDLQFADLRNDIIYVCGGPGDMLFSKSSLFALQLSGSTLTCIDTFTVSGGIPGYAQMNIMNMDSRNDTLYVVTTAAYDATTLPYSYMPIIDATGLPSDTMKKIGFVVPGLWHFDAALMDGTPFIAMSSEWCGVLISNISQLQPDDTLGFLETGGWCFGSKIRHDTLWAFHEGYGLVAYRLDSLYYRNGYMTQSKILHIYRQFVTDFDFLNDTLIALSSSFTDIYNLKPWMNGGSPVKVDSLGVGNNVKVKLLQTNVGTRLLTGWSNVLSPPEAILLFDPFAAAHPRPKLDSIQTRCSLFSFNVSNDTLYCGLKNSNKYYLAAYKVTNDAFVFIDSIRVPGEINSITTENNIIAIGCNMNLLWYSMNGNMLTQLGSFFDWFLNAQSVKLKNKLLYVADKFYGMKIFDISQLTSATLVAKCRGTGGYKNLYGSDGIDVGTDGQIYLSDFHAGIIIIEVYDSTITNISDPINPVNFSFSLFPNPVNSSILNIKCNKNGVDHVTLEITDITGKQVMHDVQLDFYNNPIYLSIKLPELKPGSYICRIFNEKFTESKQIIVFNQ